MSRIPGRVLWTVGALTVVVAMAQVAEAQREGRRGGGRGFGGRGGFGPISAVQLADAEEVQAALKLTEDQITKVDEINDQLRDDRRELFQGGGGGDFRAMREEMEKLNTEASAKLAEVLDAGQQKRLMGIQIQVNGAEMLLDAAVAKELNVTEDQKAKLEEVRDENRQAMMDAREEFQDLEREERRAKQQEIAPKLTRNCWLPFPANSKPSLKRSRANRSKSTGRSSAASVVDAAAVAADAIATVTEITTMTRAFSCLGSNR
jgi:Spy/CpxP family protein refolding chaperone